MAYFLTSKRLVSGLVALAIFSSSIPQAQAKNYNTWEEYHASTQAPAGEIDYAEIGQIGEACVDSFEKSPAYAGLTNQLYIFPPHDRDNSKEQLLWEIRSKQLQGEISKQQIDWTDLYWLRSEATQIYINQLIYNWRLESEIFRNKTDVDVGELANASEVQKAISIATDARKKITEVPNAWDEKVLINHAKVFNAMVEQINSVCEDSNTIYKNLMIAYNDSQWQNLEENEWLANVLSIADSAILVDGGVKGHIRKRIDEMRGISSWEAALYTGVMSQTMFGKMYSAKTTLKSHVGTFNTKSCVEYGSKLKKLPETKDELWKLIGNSYSTVENEFKKNLREVIENANEKDTKDLLEDYIQSNPTSIQQALWAKPSLNRAKSMCRVVQNFHTSNTIKESTLQMLSPITMLATFMTGGATSGVTGSLIAYSALVLNTYFIGSTIVDLAVSKDLENRIQGALLSNQIDTATGEDMMKQLQASRPFSYLNIVLSGLGATAALARLARISKVARYKDYIDAQGGSTLKKFTATKEAYFGKQIKSNALTRTKIKEAAAKIKAPEPKGVKHDLGVDKLKNYLNFAQNEANAETGIVKTGPDTFIKPSANPNGSGFASESPKGGNPTGGKPSFAGQRPVNSSQPVAKKPGVATSVAPKPNTTTQGPINQVQLQKPTNLSTTTAMIPQTKPYVKDEEEPEPDPNVVPMPVKPDVIVPPVWPRIVESPEGHASAAEKVKQDHAQQKKNHQKLAETAIENDLNETNVDVIEAIQDIAKGQGDFAKKARDWLVKHGTQTSYGHSSDVNEQMRRNKKMRMEIEKDFLHINNLNEKLINLLKKRNSKLEELVKANIVKDEAIAKLLRKNLLAKVDGMSQNSLVIDFDQLSTEARETNKALVRNLTEVVIKYGFDIDKIETSNGTYELEIIPTSKTRFYQTLMKYSQSMVEDPLNYFKFVFNPVELHIHFAAATVSDATVEFGLDTVKNILLNELSTVELHEIRHLYFELLRKNKIPSLFHQAYQFDKGRLNTTKTYEHYASAEEITAYGNDLKEEVALIRSIQDSERRSSILPMEDVVDFEEIDSIAETLFNLDVGYLNLSEKFMKAINERSYTSIVLGGNGDTKSAYTTLETGEILRTDFVSPEQRKIFGDYFEDQELNKLPFLKHIYNEQLKLNHLAYNQIILLVGLSRAIADFNAVDEAIEGIREDFIAANHDALISEIEEKVNDLRSRANLNTKVEDILGLSLRIYQIGKESGSYFNINAQKQDSGHWKHVVLEPFNRNEKSKETPSTNAKPNSWKDEKKSSSSEKKTGKSEEDEILSLGTPYGDTKFLDQLKFHVVDINDKGRNDVDAFFRGLVSFYKDAGVDQYELKTYTTWLVKNFNFVPFWGRNEHGVDWGYSTMQMWHKSSNLQFDVTFFVDEKNKPFVFIKAPLNKQEVMYDFHFIVTGLEKYVGPNGLIQPYQEDLSKDYFYFATGAQYPETKPTHWFKEKSDDFPIHPSHDVPTQVPNQNLPIEHVHYHEQKIVSLSRESSVESALIEKLKNENINLESIKKLSYADSRKRSSTRILKLGDETYYVKFYEDKQDPKSPGYQSIQQHEKNKKYRLTDLEYAIYLVDQHLTQRYADSFLFEIDGEKVFLSKRLNLIAFNYVDFLGNRYNQIPYDEMARLYLMNHPTSQGPVNYMIPGDIILFDLLTGNSDRDLAHNVNLVGKGTFNYRESPSALEISKEQYEVMIFDGGLSFAVDASAKVKDAKVFWNWYEEYFYNDLLNKDQEPRSVVKQLIKDNPAFIQKLLAWNAEQIKTDLPNLSEEHFAQFLKNRQFILDLASEETNQVELEIQKIKSLTKENWLNQVKSQVNYLGSGYTGVVLQIDENTVLKINHRMIEKNNPIDLADQVKALKILKEAGYRAIAPMSEIKIGNFADGTQFAYVQFTKVVGKELDYALASSGLFGESYKSAFEMIQTLFITPAKQKLMENGMVMDENHILEDIYYTGNIEDLKKIISSGNRIAAEEFFKANFVWLDPVYSGHNSQFD